MRYSGTTLGPAVCAAAVLAVIPCARASMEGTAHDLRYRLGATDVCAPCHATHNSINPEDGPLWNHALSTLAFERNSEPVTLGRTSKLCMGCHDGVTAVGTYGPSTGSDPVTGAAAFGSDLTDSHPVGVAYPAASAGYVDVSNPAVAGMLEGGRVECTSCHFAHESQEEKLLRAPTVDSLLCRTCHTY